MLKWQADASVRARVAFCDQSVLSLSNVDVKIMTKKLLWEQVVPEGFFCYVNSMRFQSVQYLFFSSSVERVYLLSSSKSVAR